LKKEKLCLV